MRVVTPVELRAMLVTAMRKLPKALQPKEPELMALMMVEQPPLDRLTVQIRDGMSFGDMQSGSNRPSDRGRREEEHVVT
jgi:hypothetical protein